MKFASIGVALTQPPQGQGNSNFLIQMLPLAVIFVIFYFLLIRPARTKQKRTQMMLSNLKPGDHVITQAGIHGTVVGVDQEIVQVRIADNVKVDFSKGAIVGKRE